MSAISTANPRNFGVKRIMREYAEFERDASANEYFTAKPCEDNLFEWHFTIRGPPDSDFAGGRYHGRILLPSQYPFKPPDIVMLTPSGRFETDKKICLSISSFHPKNWQPSWSIRTVLTALIAFFPTPANGAIGGLEYSSHERKEYALRSGNYRCALCEKTNVELLPDPEASAAPGAVPELPQEVRDTIETNKAIPALSAGAANAGLSQPGTPALGSSATPIPACPPTPMNLSQAARIAAAPSNPTSPLLARTISAPQPLAPGQSEPVGEGSMLPPPSDGSLLASAAAGSSAAATPALAQQAQPQQPGALSPLVLEEGVRQRQGRVVLPSPVNSQAAAVTAASAAPVASVPAASAPAAAAAVAAPRPAIAVAAQPAAPVAAQPAPQVQQQQAQQAAGVSSVTVFLSFLILLILLRKLWGSVHKQPAFGFDDFPQGDEL